MRVRVCVFGMDFNGFAWSLGGFRYLWLTFMVFGQVFILCDFVYDDIIIGSNYPLHE
jgi:hypothetical protein